MTILLDFDGTVVEHAYPKIGRENFGCMPVLQKLYDAGHQFILNTYRAEVSDGSLQAAKDFINYHRELKTPILSGHLMQKAPAPAFDLEKAILHDRLYIDDQAQWTPLKPSVMSNSNMVDWEVLDKIFEENGLYKKS